jgi:hypothetical protein
MTRPFIPYTERHGQHDGRRESDPSFTIESHIASLRDSDPEKWARLNLEWEVRS